jgi:hypothetical protein
MAWMLWGARGDGWAAALTPFSSYNIGSVLVQWAIVLVVLIALNRFLVGRSMGGDAEGGA